MEKILHQYNFDYNEGYIVGFSIVESGGDFYGQMSDHPEVMESFPYGGWYTYDGTKFVEDAQRKEEMIYKREHQASWQETMEAQVTYTAMMTDTLIEAEV